MGPQVADLGGLGEAHGRGEVDGPLGRSGTVCAVEQADDPAAVGKLADPALGIPTGLVVVVGVGVRGEGLAHQPGAPHGEHLGVGVEVGVAPDGVVLVADGDRRTGHGEQVDGGPALCVGGEGAQQQRVAVEDELAVPGDVGEPGEAQERVVPLRPDGLPGLPAPAQVVPLAECGVVVDADQVAVESLGRRVVEEVRHHQAELHVGPRALTHPLQGPHVALPTVAGADGALVLVVADLVPPEEVDPQEDGPEVSEVLDVAPHVLLGPVPAGVDPLELAAAVEEVARVDDVSHGHVGPPDDLDRAVCHRRLRGPQRVVVDAELHAALVEVVGPPRPVVLPVVAQALDVAVGGDVLVAVDPAVRAHHLVAVGRQLLGDPVDVGLPHRLGDLGVLGVAVAVGAPVEGAGPALAPGRRRDLRRQLRGRPRPPGRPRAAGEGAGRRRHPCAAEPAGDECPSPFEHVATTGHERQGYKRGCPPSWRRAGGPGAAGPAGRCAGWPAGRSPRPVWPCPRWPRR